MMMRRGMGDFTWSCVYGTPGVDAHGDPCCPLDEALGLCTSVGIPASASPAAAPPPAPQTQWGMTNFSPDVASEITAQQGVQYAKSLNAQPALASSSEDTSGNPGGISTSTWVLLGIAATLGLILAVKR